MQCRPLTRPVVEAAPVWLQQEDLRPDRWRDESTRAAGGWAGDELVVVGRIFTSRVHASRYWTEVIVAPGSRHRGYGRQMLGHLVELRAEDKPLCTRGYVSAEAVSFARHLGARPYQTCPPETVATSDALGLRTGEVLVVPGAEVPRHELERAWVDTYAWVHASWSPVAAGFEEPLLAGFRTDISLDHTRLVATSTVLAGSYVFLDEGDAVIVAECRSPVEPLGLDLLRACVRASLLSLAAAGVQAATFDGHDTDPHFRPLLGELPTTGEAFELLEWLPGGSPV
ncbi:hypothetical protein [uncultured Friedmanniella sp.]|uniref:hypothetical protein n=1 Tax=uncultured Friedmanniella sp. TaxID=335381 RepID=UPI0035CC139D